MTHAYYQFYTFRADNKRQIFHTKAQAFKRAGELLKENFERTCYAGQLTVMKETTTRITKKAFISWWMSGDIDFEVGDSQMIGTVTLHPPDSFTDEVRLTVKRP